MQDINKFVNHFYSEFHKNKNFLVFLITGSKPFLSEILLANLVNLQINNQLCKKKNINILDKIFKDDKNYVYFKVNKKKTNLKFLFYDLCFFICKENNNLYKFKNISLNIKEEILEKDLKNLICLKLDENNKDFILEEQKSQKLPNTQFILKLVESFGFDWIYCDNFFQKIDYLNTLVSYAQAKHELSKIDHDFNVLLSNNFISFKSSRSENNNIEKKKNIKFFGNSESFLNFFDHNNGSFNLVKLSVGDLKFNEAVHKLDRLCFDKNLVINKNFSDFNFAIQSGLLYL